MAGRRPQPTPPAPDDAVFVISVAAQLSGLHPQTLRTYERVGLITPGRTGGGGRPISVQSGGRRYSYRDVERLRAIAELTAAGIGIEGVKRILDLENAVDALRARNTELVAELEATREALRQALAARPTTPDRLPALRQQPSSSQAVVVWRRPR
ncbi:MerR family transcriptional regulator/heat shock protein HspR [Nocardioides sp. J9]|uniref:heat shock protein transcriptional repressor HspR n=1 Tax=Nocardioides sp. J9 TaxID=935844 RepID=UPI0011A3E603|nr:MerR family transcriptional regulator [Nocardioides sp. J9]TWG91781.1 MerR family transcriptional regulator/heat shock protein HspR [Nocardioides sp. J9]TWG94064.1 MerR family transcriptional regulator/heat shock protein HspR [Nocardioides sp. J9]